MPEQKQLQLDFAELLPPLGTEEFEALKASIKEHGVRDAVCVDENGVVLDGRHRLKINPKAPRRVIKGLTPAEKQAFVFNANFVRRNLSPEQKVEAGLKMRDVANALKVENPKKNTQKRIGALLGVARNTVSGWLRNNVNGDVISLDAKVKIPRNEYAAIYKRAKAGESIKQIAADYGTSERRIQQIVAAETKRHAAERERKKAAAAAPASKDARIIHGDCIAELAKLKAASATLVFADPPYNIGIDYGDGKKADSLSDAKYMAWVNQWLAECARILSADGALWVMIGDEYAAEYCVAIKALGFTIRNWIKWYEAFGVNCSNKFNRCSRHLFYAVKSPKKFIFHSGPVSRESDRQAIYKDKRADHHGKLWDDVWLISRLTGTSKERIRAFPTQLPLELLRAVIGCASNPGDLIVDPFAGSGTSGVVCVESGRTYLGIEKSKRWATKANQRLAATTRVSDVR